MLHAARTRARCTQYERLAEVRARASRRHGRPRRRPQGAAAVSADRRPRPSTATTPRRSGRCSSTASPIWPGCKRNSHRFADRHRAARPRLRPHAGPTPSCGRTRAGWPRRSAPAGVRAGDVIVFDAVQRRRVRARRGSPRSGWARSRRRSTSASRPARSPTCSTTAARPRSSTTGALAQVAAEALARATHPAPARRGRPSDGGDSAHRAPRPHSQNSCRRRPRRRTSRRRASDLRRDDPPVHLGHHRDAQGRVAERAGRGAVRPRRDHALPALARGPHPQHDAVVSSRRPVLGRAQPGALLSAPRRWRCARSTRPPCSTGSQARGLTFLDRRADEPGACSRAEQIAAPA